VRTKITDKIEESRRTTGGFGPPFPYQISAENYTIKDSVHRESSKKKEKPTGRTYGREMERGGEGFGWMREMRDFPVYLSGILHNPQMLLDIFERTS